MNKKNYFRRIPKVDILLKEERIQELCECYGRGFVVECIREELDQLRMVIAQKREPEIEAELKNFTGKLVENIRERSEYSLKRVCNATGIILHTNLGRAPLGKIHMDAVMQIMGSYSNLEYDLETGQRGKRWKHYADVIRRVTGAEGAVAVNNNAASLTLIFSALAAGREVIVSRGESIEIGGRFRIPEVVEQSGAKLKEVGTTNRTRISDYENAITEETAALLKVHTSNYKIMGFTEEASVEELVSLGEKYHIPVIVDLGSGVLVDLEQFGLMHEPTVQEMVKKGADLVCFSGDKLLGGPQAGIIAGKQRFIQAIENYPLMRAIRLDRCTIAALEATFREYLNEGRALQTIPVLHMISRSQEELRVQAETILADLQETLEKQEDFSEEQHPEKKLAVKLEAEPSISMVGGGSLPGEQLPSYAVTLTPLTMSCEELAAEMRRLPIPIITHIKSDKIWLDMRTIMPEEVPQLQKALEKCILKRE